MSRKHIRVPVAAAALAFCTPGCLLSEEPRLIVRTGQSTAQPIVGSFGNAHAPLRLTSRTSERVVTTGIGLAYIASVPAPVVDGVTLQATDVSWNGDTLIAGYNVRGPLHRGAIQIIDMRMPYAPTVIAEAIYPNTDIARVVVSGDTIIATAANAALAATLERFELDDDELVHIGETALDSYSGTYVNLDGYHAFATSGDHGGGLSIINLASRDAVVERRIDIHDARWADEVDGDAIVVSGSPSALTRHYDVLDEARTPPVSETIFVTGGSIGAPTWASRTENVLFLSADDTGLLVYDLNTLTPLAQLTVGGTANGSALSLDRRLLFLANGGAGLAIIDVTDVHAPTRVATLDVANDSGSANAVANRGRYLALADGLAGVKILTYDRESTPPDEDSDGDGRPNDTDLDDDDDGVLDVHDEAPENPDVVCLEGDDTYPYVGRFIGEFYNLACDHPDVNGPITGVVKGTLPSHYDWYSDEYYAFSVERDSLLINYSNNYFPVDEGLCDDPYYFAAHWYTTAIATRGGNYTFELGSDDDSWLFIDDELVIDLGGIHALRRTSATVHLEPGPHKIDIYFAERHITQSGLEFDVVGMPDGARLDIVQHVCLPKEGDADSDCVANADDLAPLRRIRDDGKTDPTCGDDAP